MLHVNTKILIFWVLNIYNFVEYNWKYLYILQMAVIYLFHYNLIINRIQKYQ